MSRGVAGKAKTAKRVIEIFEYFDDGHRQATVMDIVRRYKRPQSSTSELMANLVEMGLLYKDPLTRTYTPTPRVAILGAVAQPSAVRDGRLWTQIEKLSGQSGLSVALLGMVGPKAQVFHGVVGARAGNAQLRGGAQASLVDTAAGLLFLSTLSSDRRDGMLRRLNAEASAERKFDLNAVRDRVEVCARDGFVVGAAGFGVSAQMCAVLAPLEAGERPLALGFVYPPSNDIHVEDLVSLLNVSVRSCVDADISDSVPSEALFSAA